MRLSLFKVVVTDSPIDFFIKNHEGFAGYNLFIKILYLGVESVQIALSNSVSAFFRFPLMTLISTPAPVTVHIVNGKRMSDKRLLILGM